MSAIRSDGGAIFRDVVVMCREADRKSVWKSVSVRKGEQRNRRSKDANRTRNINQDIPLNHRLVNVQRAITANMSQLQRVCGLTRSSRGEDVGGRISSSQREEEVDPAKIELFCVDASCAWCLDGVWVELTLVEQRCRFKSLVWRCVGIELIRLSRRRFK